MIGDFQHIFLGLETRNVDGPVRHTHHYPSCNFPEYSSKSRLAHSEIERPTFYRFCVGEFLQHDFFQVNFQTWSFFNFKHGDMEQKDREVVMKEFRSGSARVLITTDLLARGIDVQQVSLVINYDLPSNRENYIHRYNLHSCAQIFFHTLMILMFLPESDVVADSAVRVLLLTL